MDAGLVNAASSAPAQQVAPLLMLKKAMDIQSQTALSLLSTVAPSATNNPAHLGQGVDVRA
jgi:hypothetical protein